MAVRINVKDDNKKVKTVKKECPDCDGSGLETTDQLCSTCKGSGKVNVKVGS